MSLPKFSVITVSYNQAEFIKRTIESVLQQEYPNFEHIVVDGGSTDGTVEILKQYPHLLWSSKRDRGQTDALNQGFRRATGDIIAWINSDDWYEPRIFKDVALALEDYPVVMGACQITDRTGAGSYNVMNVERSWFDLMKYWVPYSIPTQPAIFFKRSLLEQIKRPDGSYLDEDLYFTMDYDLWARMAQIAPFQRRVPRIFSYYRMYEENKTGKDWGGAEREMGKVYKRHTRGDRGHTVVILHNAATLECARTVSAINAQSLKDCEIIIAPFSNGSFSSGSVGSGSIEELRADLICREARILKSAENRSKAFSEALALAAGTVITTLESSATIEPNYLLDITNRFQLDKLGALFPLAHNLSIREHFLKHGSTEQRFEASGLFNVQTLPLHFSARRFALRDIGPLISGDSPDAIMREVLLKMSYKGWDIDLDQKLTTTTTSSIPADDKSREQVSATLILEIDSDFEKDPFARERANFKCGFGIPAETVAQCKQMLGK